MKQSFILTHRVTEEVLLSGLMDFANMYSKHSFVEIISVFKEKRGSNFLILFTNPPSLEHFAFAVNYIYYIPESTVSPSVSGYFYKTPNITSSNSAENYLKLYVSKNDQQYDNVNVVNNQNETYLLDFGNRNNKTVLTEESFEVPTLSLENFDHVLDVVPGEGEYSVEKEKPWWKFW